MLLLHLTAYRNPMYPLPEVLARPSMAKVQSCTQIP